MRRNIRKNVEYFVLEVKVDGQWEQIEQHDTWANVFLEVTRKGEITSKTSKKNREYLTVDGYDYRISIEGVDKYGRVYTLLDGGNRYYPPINPDTLLDDGFHDYSGEQ